MAPDSVDEDGRTTTGSWVFAARCAVTEAHTLNVGLEMMKTTCMLAMAMATLGCVSTPQRSFVGELASAQVYGFPLFRPQACSCPLPLGDQVTNLAAKANTVLGPGREIHIMLILESDVAEPSSNADNPFAAVGPCPVHATNTPETIDLGQTYVSVWQHVTMIAAAASLAVEVAPDSRTIILYERGQQHGGQTSTSDTDACSSERCLCGEWMTAKTGSLFPFAGFQMTVTQTEARVVGLARALADFGGGSTYSVTGVVDRSGVTLSFIRSRGDATETADTFHYAYRDGELTSGTKDQTIWGREDFRRPKDIPEVKAILDQMEGEASDQKKLDTVCKKLGLTCTMDEHGVYQIEKPQPQAGAAGAPAAQP